jgi:choline transport protein
MESMDPTVGAQYRWSAAFAPRWKQFFGLMQGWITVFAWICSCASNPALISNIITGLASFNNAGYVPKRWHSTLIMWAVTAIPFIGNLWLPKIIDVLELVGAVCHFSFFFASIITLAVLGDKSSVRYVFLTLTNYMSGWRNPAVAWGIGLLNVTYPLTGTLKRCCASRCFYPDNNSGFDGVLHMSDEVKHAHVRVPRSMIFSVVVNGIMQFLYMVTVLFTIGDVDRVSASPLPIIEVYYQATRSRAATNLFVFMILCIVFVSFFNILASVSRLVWAFSRDDGLPFSHFFSRVHPNFKLPVNALLLSTICICLLALINVGSSTAFNAFISLPAMGGYLSYFFPVLFLFWRRISRSNATPIPWGPFKLGKAGPVINAAALCYIVFTFTWMPFPITLPVDRFNMNYAGSILGGVILGGALDWFVNGRKRFRVPVAQHHRF